MNSNESERLFLILKHDDEIPQGYIFSSSLQVPGVELLLKHVHQAWVFPLQLLDMVHQLSLVTTAQVPDVFHKKDELLKSGYGVHRGVFRIWFWFQVWVWGRSNPGSLEATHRIVVWSIVL